jgi:hypothetical protein
MNGKLLGTLIMGTALFAGIAIYYLQVYGYYDEVNLETVDLRLTSVVSGKPEPVLVDNVRAIDADSSPLRFRACYTMPNSIAMLTETFVIYDNAVPLTAPGWFDCFDAKEIGDALGQHRAIAFLAQKNIHDGIDRVVAVFDDGRAYAWHQINDELK